MRKIIFTLALVWLIGYAFVARNLSLAPYEQQARIGRDSIFLENIDLSKQGTILWNIPHDKWKYEKGDAKLSLMVNNSRNLPSRMRDGSTLRIKITAEGIQDKGERNNRLIRDWYYTTDQPFTDNPKLWESGSSDSREYGLAGISVHPFERLEISVQVLNGDAELQQLKPRLKLVGDTDYAIGEHLPLLRILRDTAFALTLIATMFLFINCWRRDEKEKKTIKQPTNL